MLASIWPSAPTASGLSLAAVQSTERLSWESSSLGSIASLGLSKSKVPTPSSDEVVVSVRAIGLNFADIFCCLGLYEAANRELENTGGNFCPGLEFAGVVRTVGDAVDNVKVGDSVFGFSRFGSFRSVVVTREAYLRPVPNGWSFAQAASLLAQGLTAWHGLVPLGNVRKGSRVLIHSAAGGVGCAAMQICSSLGCETVGVVGSEEKVPFLRDRHPESTVIVRAAERQYAAQLAGLPSGGRFDCVLDSLGGQYFTAGLESLEPMGRIVHFGATHSYGGASGGLRKWLTLVPGWLMRPRLDPGKLVGTNRAVMGFNLIWLTVSEQQAPTRAARTLHAPHARCVRPSRAVCAPAALCALQARCMRPRRAVCAPLQPAYISHASLIGGVVMASRLARTFPGMSRCASDNMSPPLEAAALTARVATCVSLVVPPVHRVASAGESRHVDLGARRDARKGLLARAPPLSPRVPCLRLRMRMRMRVLASALIGSTTV